MTDPVKTVLSSTLEHVIVSEKGAIYLSNNVTYYVDSEYNTTEFEADGIQSVFPVPDIVQFYSNESVTTQWVWQNNASSNTSRPVDSFTNESSVYLFGCNTTNCTLFEMSSLNDSVVLVEALRVLNTDTCITDVAITDEFAIMSCS